MNLDKYKYKFKAKHVERKIYYIHTYMHINGTILIFKSIYLLCPIVEF